MDRLSPLELAEGLLSSWCALGRNVLDSLLLEDLLKQELLVDSVLLPHQIEEVLLALNSLANVGVRLVIDDA